MELLAPKNEQQLGNDSDDVQYQSRDYIDEDTPRKYNKHTNTAKLKPCLILGQIVLLLQVKLRDFSALVKFIIMKRPKTAA